MDDQDGRQGDDRDARDSFDELFATTSSEAVARLTDWELASEDELAGREDAPRAALGLPEVLLSLQAILLQRPAVAEIDPFFADLVRRTEIPDEAVSLLREASPADLLRLAGGLDQAGIADLAGIAVLLELKLHNDLIYWAPMLDAGRRGEFTTHLPAFRDAGRMGAALETALRAHGVGEGPMLWRLRPLLEQVREALPEEQPAGGEESDDVPAGGPAAVAAGAGDDSVIHGVPPARAEPRESAGRPTRFWTPVRAATWSILVVLMVVGTAISLLNRPVEITARYTGDEPVEQVIRSGRAVQVVIPAATAEQPEQARRASLEAIAAGLPLPWRATLYYSTADGTAVGERSPGGEIVLSAAP